MDLSEEWLRAWANPPLSADALAEALTMAGLEVEDCAPVAPPFSGVVVARVLSVTKHPNADKLNVCEVDDGSGAPLQIVCGAPNVALGLRVPCARIGAALPGDFRIKGVRMRGVESQGMLCSARELGLSDEHGGLLVLPPEAPVGADLRDYLKLDDRRYTIKLTPNRGDCLSVQGIAREVAAITGVPLQPPPNAPAAVTSGDRLPVRVQADDLCGRFAGRVIRGLNAAAPSPEWLRRRLERSGQRPISALVDISNYVMLEIGRPTHVFDLARIEGGLEVRWGRAGEQVELLNGQTVAVDPWVGVIADGHGVEALAGVMGGARTAVSLQTTDVFVEAAFWWPQAIQGRARHYNFSTEAAHRFERGVDFATNVEHLEYMTRLIIDICGTPQTTVGPIDDQVLRLPERRPVTLRSARCRQVIGVPVTDADIAAVFTRLGFAFEQQADRFIVTPPSYRFDLEIEEDLIEEVARLHGYDRIPARPPLARAAMFAPPETRRPVHALRLAAAQAGYQELVNYSFVEARWEQDFAGNDAPLKLLNPIASQLAVMRSTLIGGLVAAAKFNLNRKATRLRLFELGRVFCADAAVADGPLQVGGIRQPLRLGLLACGPVADEQWGEAARDVDFFDLKGEVERLCGAAGTLRFVAAEHPALHPGRSARVELDGRPAGWIGELHPRLQQGYELPKPPVLAEMDVEALLPRPLPQAQPIARTPSLTRDVALWFDDAVRYAQIEDAVAALRERDARLAGLREFRLFDLYRPSVGDSSRFAGSNAKTLLNKEKSLAFRIQLQDTERTLSDADADAAVAAIVEELGARLGASLRQ